MFFFLYIMLRSIVRHPLFRQEFCSRTLCHKSSVVWKLWYREFGMNTTCWSKHPWARSGNPDLLSWWELMKLFDQKNQRSGLIIVEWCFCFPFFFSFWAALFSSISSIPWYVPVPLIVWSGGPKHVQLLLQCWLSCSRDQFELWSINCQISLWAPLVRLLLSWSSGQKNHLMLPRLHDDSGEW